MPGLDVAVGVTVHQLSSTIRVAVETLDRGGATAQQLQHQISRSIVVFARRVGDISLRGAEVGIAATRAAMEAAATTGIGIGYLSEAAVRSTLRVLSRTAADPFEALRGAVFGAVQGARDTGAQVGQAAAHAVQAARAAATSLGLSEREAADHAARAALEAAEGLDREAQAEVKAAVLDELLGKEKVEPGSKPS